jgi:hypothetical protein
MAENPIVDQIDAQKLVDAASSNPHLPDDGNY